ncbi:MAG: hypothetical protein ABSB41_03785 [Anaerolineales bacterium]
MVETTRTFQCPSCGASLEPATGLTTMKCGYCGTSVVIPEDLRSTPRADPGSASPVNVDLSQLIARASQMGEVARLARTGELAAAIKMYQENSGAGYEHAKMAIEAIASGKSPNLDMTSAAPMMAEVITAAAAARALENSARTRPRRRGNSCGGTLVMVFILAALVIWVITSTGYLGTVTSTLHGLIANIR